MLRKVEVIETASRSLDSPSCQASLGSRVEGALGSAAPIPPLGLTARSLPLPRGGSREEEAAGGFLRIGPPNVVPMSLGRNAFSLKDPADVGTFCLRGEILGATSF